MATRVPEMARFSGSTKPKERCSKHSTPTWVKGGGHAIAPMPGKPLEQPSLLKVPAGMPKKL